MITHDVAEPAIVELHLLLAGTLLAMLVLCCVVASLHNRIRKLEE